MTAASAHIHGIADGIEHRQVTIGAIIDSFGTAGTGLCLLVLGGATLVPGIAPLFGAAVCTVSLGMALGQGKPYLPGIIRRRQLDGTRLRNGLKRLAPAIAWSERWLRPRATSFLNGAGSRLAGVAGLVNGTLIVLPVPFGNTAPAVAVLVLALGLVTGDGLAVAAGLGLTLVAIAIDVALVALGYTAISALFTSIV